MGKASDFIVLVKPRLSLLVLLTTACGLWLAPGDPSTALIIYTLLGTSLLVGSANAFNMYLERDLDALMKRTRARPLPAKRMKPTTALIFGLILTIFALGLLSFKVNFITGLLGLLAFLSYVFFYTPLKVKSHTALLVGAIPGALPPLMGWTAATGSIGWPGMILFGILFLWQIPHFLAIALTYQDEYKAAGIRVLPLEKGEKVTKQWMLRYLAGLIAISFYPVFLGLVGSFYFLTALSLGLTFFVWGCYGLKPQAGARWARSFFLMSIIYLPVLLLVLTFTSKTR